MGTQTLSLNWSNHKSNMNSEFQQLFGAKAFVDVTIVCDGISLKAHKMVLSACSSLFRRLLLENPCQHPVVIMTEIAYAEMEALLDFMYRGEIDITQEKLSNFLRTAEKLEIKGLSSSVYKTTIYKQRSISEECITTHISAECLNTSVADQNAISKNTNMKRDVTSVSSKSRASVEMDKQMSSVKIENSFNSCEHVESEHNSNSEHNWGEQYSEHSDISKPCSTEFAKSPVLHRWEELINENPHVESDINENSCMQQVVSAVTENLPVIPENGGLQEQIFPSVLQHAIERESENIPLAKDEQVEEECYELNAQHVFEPSSDYSAELRQIDNENTDEGENLITDTPQKGNSNQLLNSSDNKEPYEYNPQLACDVCKKSFEDLRRLCLHRRSHNHEQGPFSCATCGKTFGMKSRFICHLRKHSGKRPFSCNICNKAFLRNEHLQDHLRIHSGEKPFSCAICERKFITKGHLTIHYRSHTGEKPYVCDLCPKKFVKSSDLMMHLRGHTGEKPYCCKVCGKHYTRTANLKIHVSRAHLTEYQPKTNWL